MRSQVASILSAVSLAAALTPQGFEPASETELFVQYGNQAVTSGSVLPQNATQVQPTIGTMEQLSGTYAVLMVDLDIPGDAQNMTGAGNMMGMENMTGAENGTAPGQEGAPQNGTAPGEEGVPQNGTAPGQEGAPQNGTQPGQTNTLLHWLQTGLTSSQEAMDINGTQVFLLQNAEEEDPLAEYLGPNPPPKEPLSHRYTFVLVDHSDLAPEGLDALSASTGERKGFDAQAVLQQAGLEGGVVAGTFFNVTNAGAEDNSTVNGTSVGGGSATGEDEAGASDVVTAGAGSRGVAWGVLAGVVSGAVWVL